MEESDTDTDDMRFFPSSSAWLGAFPLSLIVSYPNPISFATTQVPDMSDTFAFIPETDHVLQPLFAELVFYYYGPFVI